MVITSPATSLLGWALWLPAQLTYRHQARVAAGCRGVDAHGALDEEAFETNIGFAGTEGLKRHDRSGTLRQLAQDPLQRISVAVVQHRVKVGGGQTPVVDQRDAVLDTARQRRTQELDARFTGPQRPAACCQRRSELDEPVRFAGGETQD